MMNLTIPNSLVLVSSSIQEVHAQEWDQSVSYKSGDTVYLQSTKGEYIAISDNQGKSPILNLYSSTNTAGAWKFIGTINKYAMFDQYLNTQTISEESIEVVFTTAGSNTIFLGNIQAKSIHVQIIDNITGLTVQDETIRTTKSSKSWKEYLFERKWYDAKKFAIIKVKPLMRNITVKLTITPLGGSAKVGFLMVGKRLSLGWVSWGYKPTIIDYSTEVTDTQSGVTFVSQGSYAKGITLDLTIATKEVDAIIDRLTYARGKAVLFFDDSMKDSLTVYGVIKKFDPVVLASNTQMTVDIKGLI